MVILRMQTLTGACIALLGVAAASSDCGELKLPWGTYPGQVCKFANIRFASPPVGPLRFAAPKYPPEADDPPIDFEPKCRQMQPTKCNGNPTNTSGCFPEPIVGRETEDCLFLDIYVPKVVLQQNTSVPVVVWIYGGAFVLGSKLQFSGNDMPLYSGQGIVQAAKEPVIFVAGNYRLGAFGWLAGTYMETHGQPNAGLLDQRAVLRFVQDYISMVKGDPGNVSVWGESAGASSIMHQLAIPPENGTSLFRRAIVQSPAYQWLWNRTGVLNTTFNTFYQTVSAKQGCGSAEPIDCIRGADEDNLANANQALYESIACNGIMPVGPSVDGKLIKDLATNVYNDPSNLADIDSLIVSHVDNEIPTPIFNDRSSFIPPNIRQNPSSEPAFQTFLEEFLTGPEYATLRLNISQQFPPTPNQVQRARTIIGQSTFYCNTRVMIDAYRNKPGVGVYAMDYAFLSKIKAFNLGDLATHATDLLPTFTNDNSSLVSFFHCLTKGFFPGTNLSNFVVTKLGPGMRSYFASHAISGNPNTYATGDAAEYQWSPADVNSKGEVTNVMQPLGGNLKTYNPFTSNDLTDPRNTAEFCDYWKQIAAEISEIYNKGQSSSVPGGTAKNGPMPASEEQIVLSGDLEL